MTAILEVRGVKFAYPGVAETLPGGAGLREKALDGVDLMVTSGSRFAILGANGAGKSTLLLHLNGLLKPSGGEVVIDGRPCDYSAKGLIKWRQKVALVFQDPDDQIFAPTVLQDVMFGPRNIGLPEHEALERADRALAAMGITGLRELPTGMLSFGQKKRLAIAGALAMRPDILIIDEPVSGLDPQGVEALFATFNELGAAGVTIVITTHDVDLAYSWADEVAILSSGRVIKQGTPETVLGDDMFMTSANMRVPWVHAMARKLRGSGLIPADCAYPKDFRGLMAMIERRAR